MSSFLDCLCEKIDLSTEGKKLTHLAKLSSNLTPISKETNWFMKFAKQFFANFAKETPISHLITFVRRKETKHPYTRLLSQEAKTHGHYFCSGATYLCLWLGCVCINFWLVGPLLSLSISFSRYCLFEPGSHHLVISFVQALCMYVRADLNICLSGFCYDARFVF